MYQTLYGVINASGMVMVPQGAQMAISVIAVEAMNMKALTAKKLIFVQIARARIWLPPRNVPYGFGNLPYASSKLKTIFLSPRHVSFSFHKTNLQLQLLTHMQQLQRQHAQWQMLLVKQT
jgi:hypothetical protein